VNPFLIRDIHDILNSLLCSSLNEKTLKRWLFLLRDIAISAENDDDEDEEDYDDSQTFQTSKTASASIQSSGGSGLGSTNASSFNSSNIRMKQITKLISPKWPNR